MNFVARIVALTALATLISHGLAVAASHTNQYVQSSDASGTLENYSVTGKIDFQNQNFFDAFGVPGNRRTCSSCHLPDQGWTITPSSIQTRFNQTVTSHGCDLSTIDAIFALNDGSNSPNVDTNLIGNDLTQCKTAFSMLLSKGLIRVGDGLAFPQPGGVTIDNTAGQSITVTVADPFTQSPFTNAYIDTSHPSFFRRPLPSTNLAFVRSVMWDGRVAENIDRTLSSGPGSLNYALMQQADGATKGHAQFAAGLTTDQQNNILAFETSFFTAQISDSLANNLTAPDALNAPPALGGPINLSLQTPTLCGGFKPGGTPCFNIYNPWQGATGGGPNVTRASIARGQAIFNGKGTCSGCHTGLNAGNSEAATFFNVATSDVTFWNNNPQKLAALQAAIPGFDITQLRATDGSKHQLPVYTITLDASPCGPISYQTTDPGFFITEPTLATNDACQSPNGNNRNAGNLNKFKPPILRGVAARAPYFHNGLANTPEEVVAYYNVLLGLNLTDTDKQDLVAFLKAL